MRIDAIHFAKLRNEEHYQFHIEFDKLVENALDKDILTKSHEYIAYYSLLIDEGIALDLLKRSVHSSEIAEADEDRDAVFHAINENVKATLYDFNPHKKQAAGRLEMAISEYFTHANMAFDEETLAINNLLQDININYQNEIAALGLADLIKLLRIKNNYFNSLSNDFVIETSRRTLFRMKEVRQSIDLAYANIIHRVNVMIFVNGIDYFTFFIKQLNLLIKAYRELITERRGSNANVDEVLAEH